MNPNQEHRFQYNLALLSAGSATVSVQQLVGSTYQTLATASANSASGSYTFAFTPTSSNIRILVSSNTRFALNNLYLDRDHVDTLVETYALYAGGYRYGFQGQEKDDEISGSGNSIDFGNRMYDPRLGRIRSLDAFASKYPSVSPYAFVYNNPISNIEIAGDSVLFYSQSGTYLGYSHDNQRYQDKNLLVIIDDNQVANFVSEYDRKRSTKYKTANELSDEQVEAHVAGLEAMGTTFDITEMKIFMEFYHDKILKDGKLVDAPKGKYGGQNEWGAFLVRVENPVVKGLNNWITIDMSTLTEGDNLYVIPPSIKPTNYVGWLHTHTNTSKGNAFSQNDKDGMKKRAYSQQGTDTYSAVTAYDHNKLYISVRIDNSSKGSSAFTETFKGQVTIEPDQFKNAK